MCGSRKHLVQTLAVVSKGLEDINDKDDTWRLEIMMYVRVYMWGTTCQNSVKYTYMYTYVYTHVCTYVRMCL